MNNNMSSLLSPTQTWAHAVDNRNALQRALNDDGITAIETDLVMGQSIGSTPTTERIPIMAHPPNTESDLSMTDFLSIISKPTVSSTTNTTSISIDTERITYKSIKLDFKEMDTVEPTLKKIKEMKIATDENAVFFLNADILPGPGHREAKDVAFEPGTFLETCLKYMLPQQEQQQQSSSPPTTSTTTRFAFSLGFKADCTDKIGYTKEDLHTMSNLITEYKLIERGVGIVLAINARQLAKSMPSFDAIMAEFPQLQILVWTGKGEPPIPRASIQTIEDHFEQLNMTNRIGYDCQVSAVY